MTPTQLTQLKAVALADATAAAFMAAGNDTELAQWFNAAAIPSFWVYRRNIPSGEIGTTVNYVAVAAMTTANLDRVNNFLSMNRQGWMTLLFSYLGGGCRRTISQRGEVLLRQDPGPKTRVYFDEEGLIPVKHLGGPLQGTLASPVGEPVRKAWISEPSLLEEALMVPCGRGLSIPLRRSTMRNVVQGHVGVLAHRDFAYWIAIDYGLTALIHLQLSV